MKNSVLLVGFLILIGGVLAGWFIQSTTLALQEQASANVPSTTDLPNVSGAPSSTTTVNNQAESPDDVNLGDIIDFGTTTTENSPAPVKPSVSVPSGITASELAAHNSQSDCWVGYKGEVYDVTSFIPKHPGGVSKILRYCGTTEEFTAAFNRQHGSRQDSRLGREAPIMGELA